MPTVNAHFFGANPAGASPVGMTLNPGSRSLNERAMAAVLSLELSSTIMTSQRSRG
jgi:hypothetical protein